MHVNKIECESGKTEQQFGMITEVIEDLKQVVNACLAQNDQSILDRNLKDAVGRKIIGDDGNQSGSFTVGGYRYEGIPLVRRPENYPSLRA